MACPRLSLALSESAVHWGQDIETAFAPPSSREYFLHFECGSVLVRRFDHRLLSFSAGFENCAPC